MDKKTKIDLYKSHNVSIAPMHVHGGAVIFEATEFAHAIIYFETHTSAFTNCGYEIKVPYYYYSVDYFGIKWNNLDDFKMVLDNDKKNGLFDIVLNNNMVYFIFLFRSADCTNFRRHIEVYVL